MSDNEHTLAWSVMTRPYLDGNLPSRLRYHEETNADTGYGEWIRRQLADVMEEAGNEFIRTHSDLFYTKLT